MVSRENPRRGMSQASSNSQGGASLHIGRLIGGCGQGQGSGRTRCNGESGEAAIPCQRHGDWNLAKVLALISYKHAEQVVQKKLIDLYTHMVPSVQRWEKIVDELQKKIKISKKRHNV
jgi:hypothetical protein